MIMHRTSQGGFAGHPSFNFKLSKNVIRDVVPTVNEIFDLIL